MIFVLRHYTYSTKQDYPSIGHINHLAKEFSVNVIWAVTEKKIDLYRSLSTLVSGSSAGVISADSSNIVELVKKQYEQITKRFVQLLVYFETD